MPKLLNQENSLRETGAIPPLVIAVIAITLIGGFFLVSKSSNTSKTPVAQQEEVATTDESTTKWETYKDKQYGYSLDHPTGWTVENLESEGTRLIRANAPDKSAFVIIEGIAGPALEDEKAMMEVVDYLENQLKNKEGYKVTDSKKANEGGLSGYIAEGENTSGDVVTWFEERFMVAKSGRGIRMHAGYPLELKDTNQKITRQIMSSFKTN